jgi:tetratricopeptide (TPR) repeat protein
MNHDPMQDLSPPHAGVWLVGSVVVALGGGFLAGWIHRHGILEREAALERGRNDELAAKQRQADRLAAAQTCARALDDAWAWRLRRRHPAIVTRALCRAAGVADASDPTRTKGEVLREAVEALKAQVAGLPPVPELAAELDDWALLEREQKDADAAGPLQELARMVDPDPRRTELRALASAANGGRLRELAAAPPALPASTDPPETLALLIKALAGEGLADVATRLGERSVADHPDVFELRVLLADLLFDQGPPAAERARLHYEVALALRPASARAAAHLGWLLTDQAGEGRAAIDLMEVATRRHPTDAALSWIRAATLARARHFAEARQHFQQALEIDPRCALAQAGIGDTFIARGDNQDLRIEPPPELEDNGTPPDPARSEQAWNVLLDQAKAAYEESLRLFDTAEGRDGLASVLFTQGDFELASNELEEAVRRHPDDAILRGHLGGTFLMRNRSLEALQQFREAVRIDEWDAAAQNDYAWELCNGAEPRLRRPGQALEHARRACELDGGNAWYRNTLGVACFRAGDFEQCVVELTAACSLPGGGGALDHFFLAMASHELGDTAAAREHYALALAGMNPADREMERVRVEASTLLGLEGSDR